MKLAVATIAYREARFLPKFLDHIPEWIETKLVLASIKPWNGDELPDDGTIDIASKRAEVIAYDWRTETEQRNAGQEYLHDYDWIIWLDPDEFLDAAGWGNLLSALQQTTADAVVVERQRVFYKDKEVDPHTDYQQMIACRPSVRFTDKRVVDVPYATIPVTLFHFSWARTDDEVLQKIRHYAHAGEFDGQKWYEEVWKAGKTENLHPKTPDTLKGLIEAKLPKELEDLHLWPEY